LIVTVTTPFTPFCAAARTSPGNTKLIKRSQQLKKDQLSTSYDVLLTTSTLYG